MIQRRIENDGIVSIHSPYYVTFFFCNVFLNVPYLFLVFMWIRIKLILERINFAIKREKNTESFLGLNSTQWKEDPQADGLPGWR